MKWLTEQRALGVLVPYGQNPRTLSRSAAKRLKQSIKSTGYVEIIVVDTENIIIAGHQRYQILLQMFGVDHIVDVRIPERKLTKKEFNDYLISSNKNTGEWDYDILSNSFDPNDLIEYGFSEKELGMEITSIPKQRRYKLLLDDTPEVIKILDENGLVYRRRAL